MRMVQVDASGHARQATSDSIYGETLQVQRCHTEGASPTLFLDFITVTIQPFNVL